MFVLSSTPPRRKAATFSVLSEFAQKTSPCDHARRMTPRRRPTGLDAHLSLPDNGETYGAPHQRGDTNAATSLHTTFDDTQVAEVMQTAPLTFALDMPLGEAASLLDREPPGVAVAVVDSARRCLGFLSREDILAALYGDGLELARAPDRTLRVSDAMSWLCFVQRCDAPLHRAVALLDYEGVAQLAVVDYEQRLVGTLSTTDINRWLAKKFDLVNRSACNWKIGCG
ncbi:MAG: CBS domain-containing protein [Deltaproteobacteria bacterium]|nr:MAG: CBS domain-containing protein [Deltaproteobacteria bacterium]